MLECRLVIPATMASLDVPTGTEETEGSHPRQLSLTERRLENALTETGSPGDRIGADRSQRAHSSADRGGGKAWWLGASQIEPRGGLQIRRRHEFQVLCHN